MAGNDFRRQPDLVREPEALGSLRAYKIKKQIIELDSGGGAVATETFVNDAIAAHEASTDPHTQYVTHDAAIVRT